MSERAREAAARALKAEADRFSDPVSLYIHREAAVRAGDAAEAAGKDRFDAEDALRNDAGKLASYAFLSNAAIDAFLAALSEDGDLVERVAKAIGARHEAGYTLGALYSENMRELARAAIAATLKQEAGQ